jgi:HNH endonuclease
MAKKVNGERAVYGDERLPLRFWRRVSIAATGCWLWVRPMPDGYGRLRYGGKGSKFGVAHRFSYEALVGSIPLGLQLDHLCRVRNCVNPDHLEPVTSRENTFRGDTPAARNAAKTHCPAGHEYDNANTYICKRGIRMCRACSRDRMRKVRSQERISA